MRKIRIGAVVATVALTSVIGAGAAQAIGPTPGPFQMCGYVYSDPANVMYDKHMLPYVADDPPASLRVGTGYRVTGQLSNGVTYSANTNTGGGYCLQGDPTLMAVVMGGGDVEIINVEKTVPAPPVSLIFEVFRVKIDASVFASHQVGLTSATGFHVKI